MSPARKTTAILVMAGAIAASAFLLSAKRAATEQLGFRVIDGGMVVQAHLPSQYVLEGTGETHLVVTLSAPRGEQTVRPPLNVAVVIDRSGSMGGKALADAKLAARQLITQLRPSDRFTVISYGTHVDVEHPSSSASPDHKRAAIYAIERIQDSGQTNIAGALMAARAQLIANPAKGAVERIILISDGAATTGQCTRSDSYRVIVEHSCLFGIAGDIAREGISITTVGLGEEFDSRTMTGMATAGRGNYYFVASPEYLAGIFNTELGRLSATTATEVSVSLRPTPGVEVLEVYGYPLRREGSAIEVPIADLHAGETRKVVFRLQVSAKGDFVDLARIHTSFKTAAHTERRQVRLLARAQVTRSTQIVNANRDKLAMRHIERVRTAKAIEEANSLYEDGRSSAAQQVLQQRATASAEIAADLGDDELRDQIAGATRKAQERMHAAPKPASRGGKRAAKGNAADAYSLFH